MEFSIKLAGSSMPQFSIKKNNMGLNHFILPEKYFKANFFFSHYDPPFFLFFY